MKSILLTKNYVTIVDDEDYDVLIKYKWFVTATEKKYAKSHKCLKENGTLYMHRFLLGLKDADLSVKGDHINGNSLDNRRCNLRKCSDKENSVNAQKGKDNRSGYKGVHFHSQSKKWRAAILNGDTYTHLGKFDTAKEAARAYDAKAFELFGEFAWLNFGNKFGWVVPPPAERVNRYITATDDQIGIILKNYRLVTQAEIIKMADISITMLYKIIKDYKLPKPNKYRNTKTGEEYLDLAAIKTAMSITTKEPEIYKKILRGTLPIEKLY